MQSLCGGYDIDGKFRWTCLTYGVIASAVSYSWKLGDFPSGMRGSTLVSMAVPYGAFRITPSTRSFGRLIAIDVMLYSAYLSTTPASAAASACVANGNALERSLHCEANPTIHPYAALGIGVTFGKSGLGYVTLMPLSIGYAQYGAQGIFPYVSMFGSVLNVTGRF
jgi:hypothetical protein